MVMRMLFESEGCYIQKVFLAFSVPWRELLKRSKAIMILLFTGYLQSSYIILVLFINCTAVSNHTATYVGFFLQLLVSYGDTGTKGALSDEDVLSSAKCEVQLREIIMLIIYSF